MRLPPLTPAVLLRRYKRFLADVRLPDGTVEVAHLGNPGRMISCLREGETPVMVARGGGKLAWSVELADPGVGWVLVNPARANRVVGEAFARIPELAGYAEARAEVAYGEGSRVDWLLSGPGRAFVEVKSVTMVRDGVAAFPDAVTARGVRHLQELERVVASGDRGVLLFHVARPDGGVVTTADDIDPAYGRALRHAVAHGVEVLAYRSVVTPEEVTLKEAMPVSIAADG